MLPAKKYRLGLHNPVTSSKEKYNSFLCASGEMIGSVKSKMGFSTANHIQAVKEESPDGKKDQDVANDAKLQGIVSDKGD